MFIIETSQGRSRLHPRIARSLIAAIPRQAPRGSVLAALLLSALALTGCPSVGELRPSLPEKANGAPPDPMDVRVPESLLVTHLSADLEPLVQVVRARVLETIVAALGRGDAAPGGVALLSTEAAAGAEAPPADADQPEPGWARLSPTETLRVEYVPDEPLVELREGVLVVELPLRFTAALNIQRPGRRAELRACGCDRQVWCGESREAPLTARARWSAPLMLRGDLTLGTEPTFELEVSQPCRINRAVAGAPLVDADALAMPIRSASDSVSVALARQVTEFAGVREAVKGLWRGLSRAAPLTPQAGPWLRLRPMGVEAGPLRVSGTRSHFPVRVAVSPVLATDAASGEDAAEPVPRSTEEAEGFRVVGRLGVPLSRLENKISARLVGRVFPSAQAERSVRITSAKVYGTAKGVAVQLNFTGGFRGRLILEGNLVADSDSLTLRIAEPELTPESVQAVGYMFDETQHTDLSLGRTMWIDGDALQDEIALVATVGLQTSVRSLNSKTSSASRYVGTASERLFLAPNELEFLNVTPMKNTAHVLLLMAGRVGFERGSALIPLPEKGSGEGGAPAAP